MRSFLKPKIILVALFFAILGALAHSFYYLHIDDRTQDVIQLRESSVNTGRFINPLILVADNRKIEYPGYADLKNKIGAYINNYPKEANKVENISYYFRNMDAGDWIGVNEDDVYAPSSMLKVTILMAYSRLAESDPQMLLQKIYYKPGDVSGQNYQPTQLPEGDYTIKDLLTQMIVESDNEATDLLYNLHTDEISKIHTDLRLPDLEENDPDFMSPRYYSRLFRALYNASYVSHFYSDQSLNLLSYTKFNRGITSATGSTTVSHKFGEFTNMLNGKVLNRELHDCGIVYYPGEPYFVCVMTKGERFENLEKIISDLSRITFDYIKNKK